MVQRDAISTAGAPTAIGPYEQAIVAGGLLFCSGQIPLDPVTGALIDGDIVAQTERCLQSLDAIANQAGTALDRAVRCTIYLIDLADFEAVNAAYAAFFREPFPARACVQVAALPRGAGVEIDAIIALG